MRSVELDPTNRTRRPQNRREGSGQDRVMAPWKSDHYLQKAIVAQWIIATSEHADDAALLHYADWVKRFGLTHAVCARKVVNFMPDLPTHYDSLMRGMKFWGSTEMPVKGTGAFDLRNRLYVCYWRSVPEGEIQLTRFCYSQEHPMNNPLLKPHIDEVRRYYNEGRQLRLPPNGRYVPQAVGAPIYVGFGQ